MIRDAGLAVAYSRASLSIVEAGTEVMVSAHSGVFGMPSSSPKT